MSEVASRRTLWWRERMGGWIVGLVLVLLYQMLVLAGVNKYFFPTLSMIWEAMVKLWAEEQLLMHIRTTLGSTLVSFVVAVLGGLPLGFLVGFRRERAVTFEPVIFWFYAIPLFILYPLIVLWVGVGQSAQVVYSAIYAFFPVCLNTIAGMTTRNTNLERLARSMGASPRQMLIGVRLPAALPGIFAGLRSGLSMAYIGVVATEMIISARGIGNLLAIHGTLLNLPAVYGLTVLAIVFGLIFQHGLAWVDDRINHWRAATGGRTGGTGMAASASGETSGRWLPRALYRTLVFCGVFVAWQLFSMSQVLPERLTPGPLKVLPLVLELLADEPFMESARVTALECLLGFALVAAVGTLLGLMMGRNRRVYAVLNPVVNIFFSFPKMTLLPLFVFAFGIDIKQKVVFAFFSAVWVMIVSVTAGVQAVDVNLERLAISMGARPWQLWRTVYIPSIVPLLFVGLRSSVVFVFLGVIVTEMAGSRYGVGKFLLRSSELGNVPYVMATILMVSAVAILFNAAMEAYQQKLHQGRVSMM